MEPIFTMQYGEFAVADYLSKKIHGASVFVPASAQEKGIDLLLYRFADGRNQMNTIQVKMSRTYYSEKPDAEYPYTLWFYRFPVQENADWYVFAGIYAKLPYPEESKSLRGAPWGTIMLAFTNNEMKTFMSEVKQKKDPTKDDKMFGFGFDDAGNICQTRGYFEKRDMSSYLIENRVAEIEKSFR